MGHKTMGIVDRVKSLAAVDYERKLDELIGLLSPETEMRRIKARLLTEQLRPLSKRNYKGATHGRRADGWVAGGSSPDAALAALSTLRARSRDLVRNNPYAERGLRVIAANTVGTGIIPQAKTNSTRRTKAFEAILRGWCDEPVCDVTGTFDFYGLQNQVMQAMARDGGILVRKVKVRSGFAKGLPPVQLQLLELDYLDTGRDGINSQTKNRILQGIEVDTYGKKVAYYLFPEHPGTQGFMQTRAPSVRIPADEILLVYRPDRAGQILGVPWLAPAILRLRDLDDYENAQLVRQKIAACYTAFVEDPEGLESTDAANATVEAYSRLEPGAIEFLTPGKKISFATPPVAEGYGEHTRAVLRAIAISLGVSYEALTGDLSQVNFSAARMGWLEMHRNITQWQQQILIPQFCRPVFRWVVEAADLAGLVSGSVEASWTPPRREMIDPTKEAAAYKTLVRNGFMTLSDVIRQSGRDVEEVLDEIEADHKALDKRGILLDSDPRRRTNIGYDPNGTGATLDEGEAEKKAEPVDDDETDDDPEDVA